MNVSWQRRMLPEGDIGTNPLRRVLLVSVEWSDEVSKTPMLGPAILVAHARRNPLVRRQVEFEICQFSLEQTLEKVIERISAKPYDLIGFSCYIWSYYWFEQIIPIVRALNPKAVLIMGGPQVFDVEEEVLRRIPQLDIVAVREGETAFAEVVMKIVRGERDWSTIGGLVFRTGEELVDTRSGKRFLPFEAVASPYIEGVIDGPHHNFYLGTYRGCPYRCAYCIWGGVDQHKLDQLSLDRVRRELAIAKSLGADTLGFFDPVFNLPVGRAREIFDLILEMEQFRIVGTSLFAQTLTDDLAQRLGKVKSLVGVGLQSQSEITNRIMNRPFNDGRMSRGIELMRKYGLYFALQLIIGLPGDTLASIKQTLEYAVSLRPSIIDAFRLMVLPGSRYRATAESLNMVYEPHPFHYIICHHSMNPEEINQAERMAQALALFYNFPRTREIVFQTIQESGESITDFSYAVGTFIEDFHLLNREDLRQGDVIRKKNEKYLFEILESFKKFRYELAGKLATTECPCKNRKAGTGCSGTPKIIPENLT